MKDRIRKVREYLGFSQAGFAKRLGVNQGTVSRWEKGLTTPSESELRAIAYDHHVSYTYLKTGQGDIKQTEQEARNVMFLTLFYQLNPRAQQAVINVLKRVAITGKWE